MDKELTDEQKDKINEIITIDPIPDVVAAVPDDNPNDNKYQVIDKNGVVYDVEVPEEYSNATEEDWENYKRELEEQKAIEELFNKNNTNSNKKDAEVIDSQLEDPEDDGKNAPSEDTPSTGDPQGPTPGYNPWENDDSNVVIDTRTEEQKQQDIKDHEEIVSGVTGTIQAGGLGN